MIYSVFGITVACDLPLRSNLRPGKGPPDVVFSFIDTPQVPVSRDDLDPIYASPFSLEEGLQTFYLYQSNEWDILRFTHKAMNVYMAGDQILCQPVEQPVDLYWVEGRLLSVWLAFWLEKQGIPMLHASAVAVGRSAVGFLSDSGQGKSTLAMTMVQNGHALVSDDIVPVVEEQGSFWVRPGYPQLRLWPAEARHFLGGIEGLELVNADVDKRRVPIEKIGAGRFSTEPCPLAVLYVPEKYDPKDEADLGITIEPIRPHKAFMELVRYSFIPRFLEAVGLQAGRLAIFARLVEQVPVRQLRYPSGFEHLPATRQAILDDLAAQGDS